MEYLIDYNPKNFGSFAVKNELKVFLDCLMRTDPAQQWTGPLTRGNLYFLRNRDGELEYFTNVTSVGQREQLEELVMDAVKAIPLKALRHDVVSITPVIEKCQALEFFCDLTAETFPVMWKERCPFPGREDTYLADSIAFVLHIDEIHEGDSLMYHVHRLYILNDEEQ